MSHGWEESAAAWIADVGGNGDYARAHVLDAPMLARVDGRGFANALDVGCGEGRFCRMLRDRGIAATGIDPTIGLLEEAKRRDPDGDYRAARAEALPFADASFDLVVSYLTLIDIPDAARGIAEMARVTKPGGALLIANLNSFITAAGPEPGTDCAAGARRFVIDDYSAERAEWVEWRGIRIRNWHRMASTYMSLLLGEGLELRHFDEPLPQGGDPETARRFRRVPWFVLMEWRKPGA